MDYLKRKTRHKLLQALPFSEARTQVSARPKRAFDTRKPAHSRYRFISRACKVRPALHRKQVIKRLLINPYFARALYWAFLSYYYINICS